MSKYLSTSCPRGVEGVTHNNADTQKRKHCIRLTGMWATEQGWIYFTVLGDHFPFCIHHILTFEMNSHLLLFLIRLFFLYLQSEITVYRGYYFNTSLISKHCTIWTLSVVIRVVLPSSKLIGKKKGPMQIR